MWLKLLGVLFCVVLSNKAYPGSGEANLPNILNRIKPAVMAVGTYMPARNPRAVFLGTGFVVGDGRLVVTNAHVTSKKLDTAHLERYAVFYRQNQKEHMQVANLIATDEEHDLVLPVKHRISF